MESPRCCKVTETPAERPRPSSGTPRGRAWNADVGCDAEITGLVDQLPETMVVASLSSRLEHGRVSSPSPQRGQHERFVGDQVGGGSYPAGRGCSCGLRELVDRSPACAGEQQG